MVEGDHSNEDLPVMREPVHQKGKAEENRGTYPLRVRKVLVTSRGSLCVREQLMK